MRVAGGLVFLALFLACSNATESIDTAVSYSPDSIRWSTTAFTVRTRKWKTRYGHSKRGRRGGRRGRKNKCRHSKRQGRRCRGRKSKFGRSKRGRRGRRGRRSRKRRCHGRRCSRRRRGKRHGRRRRKHRSSRHARRKYYLCRALMRRLVKKAFIFYGGHSVCKTHRKLRKIKKSIRRFCNKLRCHGHRRAFRRCLHKAALKKKYALKKYCFPETTEPVKSKSVGAKSLSTFHDSAYCDSVRGQKCASVCSEAETKLPYGLFVCPGQQKCCKAKSCPASCRANCDATTSQALSQYSCPSGQTCCRPKPCESGQDQRCFDRTCPSGATEKSSFRCSNGATSKCCKLAVCASIGGQKCDAKCADELKSITNFACTGSQLCCPIPSISPSPTPTSSATPTASSTSSASVTPTVSTTPSTSVSPSASTAATCTSVEGQKCFEDGKCPTYANPLPTRDFTCAGNEGGICCALARCTRVDGQLCSKSGCAYGVRPVENFNCGPSEVCCPKPSASPTPTASASSSPAAQVKPCPTSAEYKCHKSCEYGWVAASGYSCDTGTCCLKLAGTVELLDGSNNSSVPEESSASQKDQVDEAMSGEDCVDYGGKCMDSCGDGTEEDNSYKCKENKKCCFPPESDKCEGELLKCLPSSEKCAGQVIDELGGCAEGQKCCEIEPCMEYGGTCKAECGSGEKNEEECEILGGKCCFAGGS